MYSLYLQIIPDSTTKEGPGPDAYSGSLIPNPSNNIMNESCEYINLFPPNSFHYLGKKNLQFLAQIYDVKNIHFITVPPPENVGEILAPAPGPWPLHSSGPRHVISRNLTENKCSIYLNFDKDAFFRLAQLKQTK